MGRKAEDLTGQRFGKLVVVSRSDKKSKGKNTNAYWNCLCDCGNSVAVISYSLKRGCTKSCGCSRREDLVGKRFGRLVVVSYSHVDNGHISHWNTVCDCGNVSIVSGGHLKNGHTKSCGCMKIELSKARVGILNNRWNPKRTYEERTQGRNIPGYEDWHKTVFERDEYTCKKCGDYSGGNLIAHHIEGYADNPKLRTELSNGVTLCENCHKDYHHLHGYNNATREKFEEWINE